MTRLRCAALSLAAGWGPDWGLGGGTNSSLGWRGWEAAQEVMEAGCG